MTRYRVIAMSELDQGLRSQWLRLHQAIPALASPYFHPAFAEAVSKVRPRTRVTVIEDGASGLGFFPFERGTAGIGTPLAGALSDAHGVIADAALQWDAAHLVRASGLSTWAFDHLVAGREKFAPFEAGEAASPTLDLTGGYEYYLTTRKGLKAEQRRRMNKLERERGAWRFIPLDTSHATLDLVIRWKSEQCRHTGSPDIFAVQWTRALMHALLDTAVDGFKGALSSLWAAQTPVALHMGMRSQSVWHWWFPSYNQDFAVYSPGVALVLLAAEHAASDGVTTLDLGKGDALYKRDVANASCALSHGSVDVAPWARSIRRWDRWSREEKGPAARVARLPFHVWGRWARSRKYL